MRACSFCQLLHLLFFNFTHQQHYPQKMANLRLEQIQRKRKRLEDELSLSRQIGELEEEEARLIEEVILSGLMK